MRAITIMQPWAALIARGTKRYETRSWKTSHRGLVAIHAGQSRRTLEARPQWARRVELRDCDFGAIVCVADVTSIELAENVRSSRTERSVGDWTRGRYVWRLENVRVLRDPVPCRGAQSLWRVPADVAAAIEAQLVSASAAA